MKTYLKAILPFYIWAGVKFIQLQIFPIVLLVGVRWGPTDLALTVLPYTQLLSTVVNISAFLFIIWAGFRTAKVFNGSIWISATTGVSFYLFSFIFVAFTVLTIPLIQSLLPLLILGVSTSERGKIDLSLLKSMLNSGSIKSVAMWSMCGVVGGTVFNVNASRKNRDPIHSPR